MWALVRSDCSGPTKKTGHRLKSIWHEFQRCGQQSVPTRDTHRARQCMRPCCSPDLDLTGWTKRSAVSKMADVEPLHEHAAAFLYARGGVVIPPSREPGAVVHVPFALLPRQVRRQCPARISHVLRMIVWQPLPSPGATQRACPRLCSFRANSIMPLGHWRSPSTSSWMPSPGSPTGCSRCSRGE